MAKRSMEPLLWTLFSSGGVVAALFLPAILLIIGFAIPLRLVDMPSHAYLKDVVSSPLLRLALFVICSLPLFHWAHRFRFTLYDGLQIKHLNEVITILCYGTAIVGTIVAGYLLWNFD
jgi:fumarate reductase subunit D